MKPKLFFYKFIVLLVALQVLNFGLFAQDFQALKVTDNTSSFDPVDSMIEYICEVILGHKNALPENSNSIHHKNLAFHKHSIVKLISVVQNSYDEKEISNNLIVYTPYKTDYNYSFFKEINPPPPRI